jgi:phosphoglycolate phosphatase-like HAD superfamily hydrolase
MVACIVWDWNGTLLNDLWAVVDATNYSLRNYGARALATDDYRRVFRRPVKTFHEELIGRTLSPEEWRAIDQDYWRRYDDLFPRTALATHARSLLSLLRNRGLQQTLLSMTSHDRLRRSVIYHDLVQFFTRIDGRGEQDGDAKLATLKRHVDGLHLDPREIYVIGDTVDDALSASELGLKYVLVAACSFEGLDRLLEVSEVAETLTDAVRLILTQNASPRRE